MQPSGEDQRRVKSRVEAKAVGRTCVAPARRRLWPFPDALNTWSLRRSAWCSSPPCPEDFNPGVDIFNYTTVCWEAVRGKSRLLDHSEIMCDDVVVGQYSSTFLFPVRILRWFNHKNSYQSGSVFIPIHSKMFSSNNIHLQLDRLLKMWKVALLGVFHLL